MATLTLGDISDALSQVFENQITNQINTTNVGLNLITTKLGGGKNAAWTAKLTGRTDAAGYDEGADMVDGDFDAEARVDAILSWAQYRKGAKLTGLAQAAAASNHQSGSLNAENTADLFDDEVGDAGERLSNGLGRDLFSGDGSSGNPMIGLETAIAGSGTYATIDPGSFPEWVSTEDTHSLAGLSFAVIRTKLITAIYKASGRKPDLMLTDPDTFDAIGELFGDNRRWMTEVKLSDGTMMGSRAIALEGGFDVLEFDGIPVARDRNCTANTIYGLNSKFIHIKQLPAYKSPMTEERFLNILEALTGERLPDGSLGEFMAAPGSLRPYVEMLAKLGDSDRAMIKVYCQLCIKRRNVHGKLTLT